MQRRLAELNAELQATWGVELACRIGINTGEVVAGDPGTGEHVRHGRRGQPRQAARAGRQPGRS